MMLASSVNEPPRAIREIGHSAAQNRRQIFSADFRTTSFSCAPATRVIAGLVPVSQIVLHRAHRTISAGTLLYARTSLAWLPSTKRLKPRRPCEAITMRSQPCFSAVAMIPSAGALSGT